MLPRDPSALAEDLENFVDVLRHLVEQYDELDSMDRSRHRLSDQERSGLDNHLAGEAAELEARMVSALSGLGARLLLYTEALQLPATRSQVSDWINKWSGPELGRVTTWQGPGYEERESPAFNEIRPLVQGLILLLKRKPRALPDPIDHRDRERLEYCLRSLAKVCRDRGITPTSEAELQRVMHSHLAGVFRDYTTNITIAKPLLSFRPDGGVVSLKAAIECKFVASDKEVATALHGLTEDLSGYAGSADWKHFYSIIFMTDAYAVEGQFRSALGISGNAGNWTTIIVTGLGGRVHGTARSSARRAASRP